MHFWDTVIPVLKRGELGHGRNHSARPIHWIVTESELKGPGLHPLKCCCCLSSVSFLLFALLQIFLALCFLLLWCSLSQRCKTALSLHLLPLLPPGPLSPTLDQLTHSLFQSLAQLKLIVIVQVPVCFGLKLWLISNGTSELTEKTKILDKLK